MVIRLDSIESDFGTITVLKRKSTGAVAYEQGGYYQSEADSSGVSLASYIHAIFGLISQINAQNILLLGCGGGTLATMLARTGRAATIVDVNPASFAVARQYFELPDSVVCHVADGKSHLRLDKHIYDAIVLDAFHGDRIPSHLQSLSFYNLVRERLAQRGAVFANVHIKHEQDDNADRIADCMSNAWLNVRLLDSEGIPGRNAIVMAGNVTQLRAPYVITPPELESNLIDAELATMKFRTWRSRA